METIRPLGPPELPGKATPEPGGPTPQLIRSTKTMTPLETVSSAPPYKEADLLNEHVDEPGDPDGVHAAEEERRWRAEHPAAQSLPPATRKRKHRFLKWCLVLLIIAAAAYGAYWYGSRLATTPAPKKPGQIQQPKSATTQPAAVTTKHYDSTNFSLGFDYPDTWTVSDTAVKLTVVSPAVQLTNSAGAKESGHVMLTIQNQQTAIPGYPANGATAALESDKLTYKQPTSVQRAQTYLSYPGYTTANGLDALYVTGDNGYLQGQNIPLSDVIKSNPLIGVSFVACKSADCTKETPTALTLQPSAWKASASSKAVIDLLQSIQLN